MDNISELRYLPNALCLLFMIIPMFSIYYMQENLIRHKKDIEDKNLSGIQY